MANIEFKIATESDTEILAEIRSRTFYDTFHKDNTKEDMELFLATNFNVEITREEIKNPSHTFILAYHNNDLSGFLKLSETETPIELEGLKSLEIASIYTIKEKIGKGVGAALMRQVIDIAKDKNKDVIWLGVWEQNNRAIQFYQRWGFEKFGEHIFMVGTDAQNDWLMKKSL